MRPSWSDRLIDLLNLPPVQGFVLFWLVGAAAALSAWSRGAAGVRVLQSIATWNEWTITILVLMRLFFRVHQPRRLPFTGRPWLGPKQIDWVAVRIEFEDLERRRQTARHLGLWAVSMLATDMAYRWALDLGFDPF